MCNRFTRRALIVAAAAVVLADTVVFGQVSRLGALGDSLSDEYSEETYSYARNWTMQLVLYRGVSMGPTASQASQPGGTWGEPRRTGYESNWARSGADSATLLSDGQHTGLAAQVGPGGVSHAIMAIGANDFSPATTVYFNIYWGLWSTSQINSYVNQRIANVTAAVDTVKATGVHFVLCNFVDYGVAPATREFYGNATRRNRVTAAIAQVNAGLRSLAHDRGVVLVDLNRLGTAIFGTNTSLIPTLTIGGVNIDLNAKDTTGHTNPLAGFVDDGAHPHTTLQGAFANVLMAGLNAYGDAALDPFTDEEILQHAGIAYGGYDTLESEIGPSAAFVTNFACIADYDANGFVNGEDFDSFVADFLLGLPRADVDANSFVTGEDFDLFVQRFTDGC